ncbi:MAG: GTP 3',8-cyclase MoaA [Verrucomicrobiales bacterium]|nr:GTP 3',8-cyclase MoaA [Verrucomicrobiales bacterium]
MALRDVHHRPLKDLRISVTDRCNFRCTYCMPREHFGSDHDFLPRNELLSYEEITFVVDSLMNCGLQKVRLTGGEPLLRRDLTDLVSMLRQAGPELDLAMTTNGALLKNHAESLREAGLDRVTVSLDAVEPETFQAMADTEQVDPEAIFAGIKEAQRAGLTVKVNTVVRKGVNENQILPLARICLQHNIPLRFIEYMDVGNTNAWKLDEVITGAEIRHIIEGEFGSLKPLPSKEASEVARRYTLESGYEFGFIESVSNPFCGDCSRARLSANGSIYTCLFSSSGNDLKGLLRFGASQNDVQEAIRAIWEQRKDRYSMERTELTGDENKVEMSFIGG